MGEYIRSNLREFLTLPPYRAAAGEFLGSFLLVFNGCLASVMPSAMGPTPPPLLQTAFSFGHTLAVIVWVLGASSGGHVNPAVSHALLLVRKLSLTRFLLYMLAQIMGSIVGAVAARELGGHDAFKASQAVTKLGPGVTITQGVMIEFLLTATLCAVVCSVSRDPPAGVKGSPPSVGEKGSGALLVGMTLFAAILAGGTYSGASLNPARSLGPAIVAHHSEGLWIYWVGPMSGGILGAVIYEFLLAEDASLQKVKDWLTKRNYSSPHQSTNQNQYAIQS